MDRASANSRRLEDLVPDAVFGDARLEGSHAGSLVTDLHNRLDFDREVER
jgi:hypothetical protein